MSARAWTYKCVNVFPLEDKLQIDRVRALYEDGYRWHFRIAGKIHYAATKTACKQIINDYMKGSETGT